MKRFELQPLQYFIYSNAYTGSCDKLRYNVIREEDNLRAMVWRTDLCFELAEIENEAVFPLSEEGLEQIRGWLEEEYRK